MRTGLSYRRHRFPPEIISHAVWLYHRFALSFRDVEDLLAERGIIVSYEAIRHWCQKFGPTYATAALLLVSRLGSLAIGAPTSCQDGRNGSGIGRGELSNGNLLGTKRTQRILGSPSRSTSLGKYGIDPQTRDALEMPEITGDDFEPVVNCSCTYLEIGVRQNGSRFFQMGSDLSEDSCRDQVVRENGDSREYALSDVGEVTIAQPGAVGSFVKFSDHHGTRELFLPRNRFEPVHVRDERLWSEELRDGVGIE